MQEEGGVTARTAPPGGGLQQVARVLVPSVDGRRDPAEHTGRVDARLPRDEGRFTASTQIAGVDGGFGGSGQEVGDGSRGGWPRRLARLARGDRGGEREGDGGGCGAVPSRCRVTGLGPRPGRPCRPGQQRVERLPRVPGPQGEDAGEGVGVGAGGEGSGPVAVTAVPGVGRRVGEEPGPVARVRAERGGAFGEGARERRVAGGARLGGGRRELRGEPRAGPECARAPVPGPPGRLRRAVQDPGEQPVCVAPVGRGGRLVGGDPGPGVAEADPAGRGVRDPGRLRSFEGPGVEPGGGDGAQEGVGGHRVLVGGRQQEHQPGAVGQRADLAAVGAQRLGGEVGGFGRQRVEAGRLSFGQPRDEFGGRARVAVYEAQHAHAHAFGQRRGRARARVRRRRWRSAVRGRGVHSCHHTSDVTGGLLEP